jgi:hypothetical protein
VRTPLVPDRAWEAIPEDVFTPMELISEVVLKLAEGAEVIDSRGVKVTPDELYGKAVVANGKKLYIHSEPAYCDDVMERTIENTRMAKQTSV